MNDHCWIQPIKNPENSEYSVRVYDEEFETEIGKIHVRDENTRLITIERSDLNSECTVTAVVEEDYKSQVSQIADLLSYA